MINPALATEVVFAAEQRHAEPVLVGGGIGAQVGLMEELVGARMPAPVGELAEEPVVQERIPVAA